MAKPKSTIYNGNGRTDKAEDDGGEGGEVDDDKEEEKEEKEYL